MKCYDIYRLWREKINDNEELMEELSGIENSPSEIEDRFYRELEFGTGGLRGIIGAGTNRMNVYTVGKATQGYSNYLKKHFKYPTVAIAYDSRIHSDLFAETAASVFAANGISVWLYDHLMPTPSLSFAVRELGCSGGIVLTASHNPASYNGYKVYGADGCQITTEAAAEIQKEINGIDPFSDVPASDFSKLLESGSIRYIDNSVIDSYLRAVSTASLLPNNVSRDLSIVYTPLNGTGISCVPRCLKEHGFTNIIIPNEQAAPDGAFPTCPYPNPEIREALRVGLACAERNGSELLLATDPDCDRVGAAVKTESGYSLITGNEMGVLLLDFICRMRRMNGTMPAAPVAVKTIVTTPMAAKVAEKNGVAIVDVLTGFKYIGEQIGLLEGEHQEKRFILGFEESYGYLSGSFVRDKDAVNASLIICEMFAWHRSQGKTLVDVINGLYAEYGYFSTKLLSFSFEGLEGFNKMKMLMYTLRNNGPVEIAGRKVERKLDYLTAETGLPKSDVIRLFIEGGGEVVVRPSGTEPKLKVYLCAAEDSREESESLIQKEKAFFEELIK